MRLKGEKLRSIGREAHVALSELAVYVVLLWISIIGLALYGAVGLAARWWAPWADTT